MKKIILLLILASICTTNILSQIYEVDNTSGINYAIAKFRLWTPKPEGEFKALMVIVPGYNSDGRDAVNDTVWQTFALKHNLAVMACFFRDYKKPDIFYREASKGSGEALLDAINQFANESKHPEIAKIPLIMYGESAGGQFNYEFACWKPEKVLSFVVNKGGFYHTAIAQVATRKIPAIFFIGEDDLYYRKDLIKGIYSVNRRFGAHWTLIREKNIAHDCRISRPMALEFFENILPLRLSSANKLIDLSEIDYYLGDWETKTTKPSSGKIKMDSLTVWLPNYSFAKTWEQQFE